MKKKFDWNEPVTWKSLGKAYIIICLISEMMLLIGWCIVCRNYIKNWISSKWEKVKYKWKRNK